MTMPRIDLQALWQKLSKDDMSIVRRVVRENTWRLRTSRPKLCDSNESRYAAYVWRMVAFMVSPHSQHHCMPITCFWWLPEGTDKKVMQYLDRLVDEITNTVPDSQWWGVRAWSGLTADQADLRKDCLKGFKNDVSKYLKDSANRKARIANAKNQGADETGRELRTTGRSCEVQNPF